MWAHSCPFSPLFFFLPCSHILVTLDSKFFKSIVLFLISASLCLLFLQPAYLLSLSLTHWTPTGELFCWAQLKCHLLIPKVNLGQSSEIKCARSTVDLTFIVLSNTLFNICPMSIFTSWLYAWWGQVTRVPYIGLGLKIYATITNRIQMEKLQITVWLLTSLKSSFIEYWAILRYFGFPASNFSCRSFLYITNASNESHNHLNHLLKSYFMVPYCLWSNLKIP